MNHPKNYFKSMHAANLSGCAMHFEDIQRPFLKDLYAALEPRCYFQFL